MNSNATTFQNNTLPPIGVSVVEQPMGSISLHTGTEEMLRVAKDGFYIRGVRIEQDAEEARKVYECFTQWLVWAQIQQC